MKTLFTLLAFILLSAGTNAQNCIDFSQYGQPYLDSVNLLPQGSTLFAEGDLEMIRPDQWSQYQFMQGDTLMYIGNLDLDASASNCAEKELTFSCVYMEGVAVDGDTVFSSLNPPTFYQGAGWTFESTNQGTHIDYVITGDFDVAHLFSSTNFIWNVCLDCLTPASSSSCIDFSQYDQQYLDSVNFLPQGSTLFAEGDLEMIRPDQWSQYQFMQGDTLMYIGNLDLDASASNCAEKELTFSCVYMEGVAVDGDTVFSSLNPPAFYQGAGWTFESTNQGTHIDYVITGDFDVAHLFSSTNFIWNICLNCLTPTSSTNCIDFSQYDQPYVDSVNLLPPGSVLFQEGDLALIRPDQWTMYQWIQGDTLMYIGNLNMDASASNCPNKYLTFSCVYVEGIVVDGDTIFTSVNPPASYAGNGFTFESYNVGTHIEYVVVGDFDLVQLLGSTNLIWDICLECFVGLEEVAVAPEVSVYPNPTTGIFTVETSAPATYQLVSLNGEVLTSGDIVSNKLIDVSHVVSGVYLLYLQTDKGTITKRIVVQ